LFVFFFFHEKAILANWPMMDVDRHCAAKWLYVEMVE